MRNVFRKNENFSKVRNRQNFASYESSGIEYKRRGEGINGNLTGFSAGIQIKLQLLQHEGIDTSQFYIPSKGTAL